MVQWFVWFSNQWKLASCCMRSSYLTHWDGQGLNNLLMCHGNNTLTIYFNDSVSNTNAASLSYATSHQTADLRLWKRRFICDCTVSGTSITLSITLVSPEVADHSFWTSTLSLVSRFVLTRAYSQCHSAHWNPAGTWDQVSWWGQWWPEGSSQYSALPSPDSSDPGPRPKKHKTH